MSENKDLIQDNQIVLCDEEGNEEIADILFTVDHEDRHFVYLTRPTRRDDMFDEQYVEVYAFEPEADGSIGKLFEIAEDDDETWAIIDEVFMTFEENGLE